MRVPSNLSRAGVGLNMMPMIDVVFLLIIFFLVSSHLARQEIEMKLNLPDAGTGQRIEEDQIRRVVVNVLPDEQIGGRIVVGGRPVDEGELAELIGYESDQSNGQVEVRIRSDRKVPYHVVEPAMIACARAGVWKVTFAVVGK